MTKKSTYEFGGNPSNTTIVELDHYVNIMSSSIVHKDLGYWSVF